MVIITTVSSENATAESLISKWATSEDCARAKLRQNNSRRQDSLLARAALRALLAHVTGVDDWRINVGINGKPHVLTPTGIAGPYISLSHTQGLVACAVSETSSIGVDVEYWRTRDFMALADYAYGPGEREEVARDGMSAFYRIWTLREAMAKAMGVGVMKTFNGQDCIVSAKIPASDCWIMDGWKLFYKRLQKSYSLAVALTNAEDNWSEKSVTWVDVTIMLK